MAKSRAVTPSPATTKPVAAAAQPVAVAPSSAPVAVKPKSTSASASGKSTWDQVVVNLTNHYQKTTPQRTKLIDAFLAFLVAVGVLQFAYCVLAGNFVRRLPSPSPTYIHFPRPFIASHVCDAGATSCLGPP